MVVKVKWVNSYLHFTIKQKSLKLIIPKLSLKHKNKYKHKSKNLLNRKNVLKKLLSIIHRCLRIHKLSFIR